MNDECTIKDDTGGPGDPSKGAVIFRQRCSTCHSSNQVSNDLENEHYTTM